MPSGPSTHWCVRVRGENDAGASPWSDEVCLKTKGGFPGAPKDLNAEATGPESVRTTWTEPDSEDDVTGYTLTYTLRSIGECGPRTAVPIIKHTREPRLDLDGLIPDATYDIYVTARTEGGEGPKSKVVSVRTEEAGKEPKEKDTKVGQDCQTYIYVAKTERTRIP